MRKKLSQAQLLYCIMLVLYKNKNLYRLNKGLIGSKLILTRQCNYDLGEFFMIQRENQNVPTIEEVIIKSKEIKASETDLTIVLEKIGYLRPEIERAKALYHNSQIIDTIDSITNYAIYMGFNSFLNHYELSLLGDFRKYRVNLGANNFNDLNFVLDFWYPLESDIFNQNSEYKKTLLEAISCSTLSDTWKAETPSERYLNGRVRVHYNLTNLGLSDVSIYMLQFIEKKLGKPSWNQEIKEIVSRLRKTKSYSNGLIESSLYILNEFTDSDPIFPKEITDSKFVKIYAGT